MNVEEVQAILHDLGKNPDLTCGSCFRQPKDRKQARIVIPHGHMEEKPTLKWEIFCSDECYREWCNPPLIFPMDP